MKIERCPRTDKGREPPSQELVYLSHQYQSEKLLLAFALCFDAGPKIIDWLRPQKQKQNLKSIVVYY
jgi:hypothetical protein